MVGKRGILIVIFLVAVGAAGGATWFWYQNYEEPEPGHVTVYGNVEIREVELAFEVQGRIKSVNVEEGDRVDKGRGIAGLEDEQFRYELDRAKARVESQQQVVAELEAGTRPQNIRKAEADVEAAEARLVEARRNRERLAALVPSGAAVQQQLDDATATYETTVAELRVARAALDLANVGPREEDILAARARLAEFKSETDLAQWRLDKTKLLAPSEGVIRQRILEPGDMTSASRPVFTLALIDPIWIRAFLPEPDLGKVRPGMTAWVTTDSYPGKRYKGWIGFISPTAEFTPKTVQTEELRTKLVYEVRVYVDNPQGELRLGMPATVKIPLDQRAGSPGDDSSSRRSAAEEPKDANSESKSS